MRKKIFNKGDIVQVLTTEPINGGLLDYIASEDGISVGSFVEVKVMYRSCVGVVWGCGSSKIERERLKSIVRVLEITPMRNELKNFLLRVAKYTVNPPGKVMKLTFGAQNFLKPERKKKYYYIGVKELANQTEKKAKIVQFLSRHSEKKFLMNDLVSRFSVSRGLINTLVAEGNLNSCYDYENLKYELCKAEFSTKLSKEQAQISRQLRNIVKNHSYSTSLLRGVTGSGKTEVYLDAVSEAINSGEQVLVLVPEIALSVDFVERVFKRYGVLPGQWHSGISQKERRSLFRAVSSKKVNLIIGARSALFLPFRKLGLIVVDEEHDASYKQDDGVCYNARDMAVMRASLSDARVILASATPSLETWVNAKTGKYNRFDLWSRYGQAILPGIEVIDLRGQRTKNGGFISEILKTQIEIRLKRGEQSLLFLNRRGYAPITVCTNCGFQLGCKTCDSRLVFHKFKEKLICHQCGEESKIVSSCPKCGVNGRLASVGPGIERLQEECINIFPNSRVGVLSSDTAEGVLELRKKFDDFRSGEVDIIIGTQLVSKGHNFPKITLVGVIDADLGLQGSDLRAAEKTFQSLRQVSGRAGRDSTPGKAYIQTYCPEHPVILAISKGEDDEFWQLEAELRRRAGSPPFGRFVSLILSGPNDKQLFTIGRKLNQSWEELHFDDTYIYGPAFAPISKIRNRFRVRLLIKAKKNKNIQEMINYLIRNISLPRTVRMTVDVDPQNFY